MVSDTHGGLFQLLAESSASALRRGATTPGVLCAVKEREAVGYACEAANASFELLASAHDREDVAIFSTSPSSI